ncbi:MAG: pilus assembly protein CpaE [Gaiellaceae bacterium]|jgi:pilus assembly protein CpaE|nr:pilus assembly protein CpaE [Gaiellaceae bacterium]
MAEAIRILVTLAEHAEPDLVKAALEGDPSLQVLGYWAYDDDWQGALAQPGDVVVVACDARDESATHMVDRAVKHRPDRPVVVLSHASPNGFLREAFEAGADDVITLPQTGAQLAFALQKVIARRKGYSMPGKPPASVITVLGPKGGTGKTLTATNLAVALAQRGKDVVLVDLDLQFGDIGLAMGLSPERTITDLMKSGPPFDHEKLDRHLLRHPSGVKVLIAPTRPDQAGTLSVEYLRDIYASLRTMSDAVIVDTPPGFTAEVIATIDVSSDICMIGMLDSLSLKNMKLGLETLELMGYETSTVTLILNRSDSRVGIMPEDVATIIGRAPDVSVPSDREIPRSVNEGTPIVAARPGSGAARAFEALADRYVQRAGGRKDKDASEGSAAKVRTLMGRRR